MMTRRTFHERVIEIIRSIPRGSVATYGQVAAMAGNPRAARQVVRALHSSSGKENLPWYRVINGRGKISLPKGRGYEEQRARLESEGVEFSPADSIDLKRFGWSPSLNNRQ
jgi:methylated-DNA-protein-cysteine methyltransferase-like protein